MPTSLTKRKQHKTNKIKRKDRYRHQIDLGTPQVPLSNKQHLQNHELLSDWEAAS